MIASTLQHTAMIEAAHPLFAKAFAFLRTHDFAAMEPGRIDIEGSDLYALVQRYETVDASQKKWESHERYIDIQYVAAGTEICGWAPAGTLKPAGEYDPVKDIRFYGEGGATTPVWLSAGQFVVLMPEDLHRPGCMAQTPSPVIKVVLKVRVA